jgi:excinuclease UvrABC nuclease subunit
MTLQAREDLLHEPPVLNLDGTVPYRRGFAINVPSKSGIYLLHDLRGVLYVGQSDNLHRRFEEHYNERDNPLLVVAITKPVHELAFSWLIANRSDLDRIERRLIRCFHPVCNRKLYLNNK